jgi:hypothetical protein
MADVDFGMTVPTGGHHEAGRKGDDVRENIPIGQTQGKSVRGAI